MSDSEMETCTVFISKTLGGKRYVAFDSRAKKLQRIDQRLVMNPEEKDARLIVDGGCGNLMIIHVANCGRLQG